VAVTLRDYYFATDFGNRTVHLKGKRGCFYQDHMLDAFAAYANEEVDDNLTYETEEDIYIELVPRKAGLRRGRW
jgi:hypothetical protein